VSASLRTDEHDVTFEAADGWTLRGIIRAPAAATGAGVVLVPGSLHERDAFVHGRSVPGELAERGIASLRFDIRGRGLSRGRRGYHDLAPLEQDRVCLDVAAAAEALVTDGGADRDRIGVLGEQDTSSAVAQAVVDDARLRGLALLSPRLPARLIAALGSRNVPVLALVSREDRVALRSATQAYLAGTPEVSRLEVFAELGFGTTMFMSRAYVQPDEEPLEAILAGWFSDRLGSSD
jgi:dienelactone hydrolase